MASDFPTDETTLTLLIAACEINPDTGRTHLMDFLAMGSRVKSETLLEDGEGFDWGDAPTYLVEHEEGYEPFSEQQVIKTLARELLVARSEHKSAAPVGPKGSSIKSFLRRLAGQEGRGA